MKNYCATANFQKHLFSHGIIKMLRRTFALKPDRECFNTKSKNFAQHVRWRFLLALPLLFRKFLGHYLDFPFHSYQWFNHSSSMRITFTTLTPSSTEWKLERKINQKMCETRGEDFIKSREGRAEKQEDGKKTNFWINYWDVWMDEAEEVDGKLRER